MARPLRVQYPGAWYHVMNRGGNRCAIYMDKDDYELFLNTLQESCNLFKVKIAAYCLMKNHYHLLVHTPEGNLSRFMRHLNGVYTQRFNRKHRKDGPLFRGRYKAIVVEKESYLKELIRYIHLNPVKAGVCGRVNEYLWSTHRNYVEGDNSLVWLMAEELLREFAKTKWKAIRLYKEFMSNGIDKEVEDFYKSKKQRTVLGTVSFVEKIKEQFKEKAIDEEIVEGKKLQSEVIAESILDMMRAEYQVNRNELLRTIRGKENTVRMMAMMLIREETSMSLKEVASLFGAKSYRTIGTSCYRFKKRMEDNKTIKKQYEKLRRCSQEKT